MVIAVTSDIADLRRRARALLPPEVYDYYAGGSGREATLRASVKAWRRSWLAPRVLRDVSRVDTTVRLPGLPPTLLRTPVAVAPVGFQTLIHPAGEVAAAEGAASAGALYVLSTRSGRRIEDVADAVARAGGAWWYQVYIMRDRDLTASLVRRAVAAGARALVLTADTPVVGRKRRNRGEGVVTPAEFFVNTGPLADPGAAEQAADLAFADVAWLAGLGDGIPVLVKGVLRADDARACVAAGAEGVIVSNHGGRQLDGALPSALALPAVAGTLGHGNGAGAHAGTPGGAVPDAPGTAARDAPGGPPGGAGGDAPGGGHEVLVDGGLRTGEDVLAALALGARAVFLGRPVMWALACGGAGGVHDLLTGLTADLAHAMALAGTANLAEVAGLAPR